MFHRKMAGDNEAAFEEEMRREKRKVLAVRMEAHRAKEEGMAKAGLERRMRGGKRQVAEKVGRGYGTERSGEWTQRSGGQRRWKPLKVRYKKISVYLQGLMLRIE